MSISFNNGIPQNFSFPKPIMDYLMDFTNSSCLKKLYKTCKSFYMKMGLNIVEYLSINEFNEKSFESYNIRIKSNDIKLLKSNLMLNGYLGLWEKGISPLFFSKIAKCNVSTLLLYCDLKLTIREFEILTKTGNIKEINFSMNIFYDDGSKVPLEVLLLHVPKAVDISFSRYNIPKNSLKKLLLMERKVKLEAFRLLRLTQLPDLDLLNAFLKKNLVDRGIVKVFFETEEMDKQFLPQIWKTFSTWEPEKPNPRQGPLKLRNTTFPWKI